MRAKKKTKTRVLTRGQVGIVLALGLFLILSLTPSLTIAESISVTKPHTFKHDLELLSAARVSHDELSKKPTLRRCIVQMRLLCEALTHYRSTAGTYPDRLKDLIPDLLADPSLLLCPESEPGNNFGGQPQFLNNSEPFSTYDYQYSAANISYLNRKTKTTEEATLADFKFRQRLLTGDVIPLLRCHLHGSLTTFDPEIPRQVVNLSLNGIAYWSGGYWESVIVNRIARPYLTRDSSFDSQSPISRRVKARDSGLSDAAIDLSAYYNALPSDPWLYGKGDITMSSLPQGTYIFKHVEYDIRGLIQLGGPRLGDRFYPSEVQGIQVREPADGLDIIQACAHESDPNDIVGEFRIHLRDIAKPEVLMLEFGKNTGHMRVKQATASIGTPPMADIAWQGQTEASLVRNEWLRLFHIRWINPHPESRIQSLDFHSSNVDAGPFLAAVTLWNSSHQNSSTSKGSNRETQNQANLVDIAEQCP